MPRAGVLLSINKTQKKMIIIADKLIKVSSFCNIVFDVELKRDVVLN